LYAKESLEEVFNEMPQVGWKACAEGRILNVAMKKNTLQNQLSSSWRQALDRKVGYESWRRLERVLARERSNHTCYPPQGLEFEALRYCEPDAVRVVILGQDPYHGVGQAHGLAFSVFQEVPWPPSLRNVLKELIADFGPNSVALQGLGGSGVLQCWAEQGVVLLNDVLTVSHGLPGSHVDFGWQEITGSVLDVLSESEVPKVFILWGNQAKKHKSRIFHPSHLVLEAPHPSPLSAYRGFFGSKPFTQTNNWLEKNGLSPIRW
jgi:uracil-DNA glycosylase